MKHETKGYAAETQKAEEWRQVDLTIILLGLSALALLLAMATETLILGLPVWACTAIRLALRKAQKLRNDLKAQTVQPAKAEVVAEAKVG